MSAPPVFLGPAEAIDRLLTPVALETYSPLGDCAVLAIDLEKSDGAVSDAALDAALWALARLPCPSLGIGADLAGPCGRAISGHLDVALDRRSQADPVLDAVSRAPLACAALVQLLRIGDGLDLDAALVAESWVYSTLQSGPEFAAWLAARGPATAAVAQSHAEPAVLAHREGDRLELTLNRPERHNAFSAAMRDALVEGLAVAVVDDSLREIVLRGAGRSFCSGGDLDEFGTFPDPATAHAIRMTRSAGRLLVACATRLRVELHGACVGAGIELPAFAARVVARSNAFFQLPEVGMGLVPGAGGTASLPRRIGRQRTAWLALSGERIDAPTARAWGLVDELRD